MNFCLLYTSSELVYDFYRKETSPYHQHLQEAIKFSGVPENHLTESDCFIGVLESLYNQLIEYFDKKGDEENFKKITEYQKELEDLIQVRDCLLYTSPAQGNYTNALVFIKRA